MRLLFSKREYPLLQIKNYLKKYNKSYHEKVLNGRYKNLENWTIPQLYLLSDCTLDVSVFFFFLKTNVNFNYFSKKGVNVFHLFIILFFLKKDFISDDSINLFTQLLKYSYKEMNLVIINHEKLYSLLDVLVLLQTQPKGLFPKSFFPKSFQYEYHSISEFHFQKLYFELLCYNERHYVVNNYHEISNLSILDFFDTYSFMKEQIFRFIKYRFHIPTDVSINFPNSRVAIFKLIHEKIITQESKQNNNDNKPFNSKKEDKLIYVNEELSDNFSFRKEDFLNSFDNRFCFHNRYLCHLIQTKINPYTREEINDKIIENLLESSFEKQFFPLPDFISSLDTFPFLFNLEKKSLNKNNQELLNFIEQFFVINHPYNQIKNIEYLQVYELTYMSTLIGKETSFFPLFFQEKGQYNVSHVIKTLLHYCQKKTKLLNVLYYYIEEIFADLNSFREIEKYLVNIELHYIELLDAYKYRYNTSNNSFYSRFVENMLLIYEFKKTSGNIT